ncbi:alpha/beta fold hydrolase [Nocardiopsis composta]
MQTAISRDGTRIAYERRGTGPALILVHGTAGRRALDPPGGLAALLSDSFTVFGYDRRGRGGAPEPGGIVQREVDDIAALIGAAGGRAFLFGMSSGAVPALEAASRGLAVAALALYEPPFAAGGGRAPLPADYAERVGALAEEGRRAEAVDYFLTEAVGVPAEELEPIRRDPSYALMQEAAHTLAYDGVLVAEAVSGTPPPARRWEGARPGAGGQRGAERTVLRAGRRRAGRGPVRCAARGGARPGPRGAPGGDRAGAARVLHRDGGALLTRARRGCRARGAVQRPAGSGAGPPGAARSRSRRAMTPCAGANR